MAYTEIDRKLLTRCLANEPDAWKDFIDRFASLFIHVTRHTADARSIRLSQDDIDDHCADIMLQLLVDDAKVLRRFRGDCSLATYLCVLARRIVVKSLVRRRKAEALGHVPVHQSTLAQSAARAESSDANATEELENKEQIEQLINQLNGKDAEVLKMYHLEGRTYREISERLSIPLNSIGPTLTRAKNKLSKKKQKQLPAN